MKTQNKYMLLALPAACLFWAIVAGFKLDDWQHNDARFFICVLSLSQIILIINLKTTQYENNRID